MPTKWCRCPKTEAILDQYGVEWEWKEKIPLKDIKRPAYIQSRMGASINNEWRDEYAEDMGNGDTFPGTVIMNNGKGLVVAEGNHRYSAAEKNGDSHLSGYVFASEDELIAEMLFHVMNDREGHRSNVEERLQSALLVQREYGLSNQETASRFRVSVSQLSRASRAEKAVERLHEMGISPKKVSVDPIILSELDRIRNEVIFKGLANFFKKHGNGLTQARSRAIIKEVKAMPSENGSLEKLENLSEIESNASRGTRASKRATSRTNRERLLREIKIMENLLGKFDSIQQAGITNATEISECKHSFVAVASRLREIVHNS